MAPKRSWLAGNTPPTSRSATSVVVMSMTPDQQAGVDELLHRLPAGAGGVEHHAVILGRQRLLDGLHAWRGHAEHGEADGGLGRAPVRLAQLMADHARQRVRRVGEHLLGDGVDALHVRHRVHHRDVGGADVAATRRCWRRWRP